MLSFSITGNYTDLYQLTIGEVYFLENRHNMPVCFDYFFRKIPNSGGYVVFAGLEDLMKAPGVSATMARAIYDHFHETSG